MKLFPDSSARACVCVFRLVGILLDISLFPSCFLPPREQKKDLSLLFHARRETRARRLDLLSYKASKFFFLFFVRGEASRTQTSNGAKGFLKVSYACESRKKNKNNFIFFPKRALCV